MPCKEHCTYNILHLVFLVATDCLHNVHQVLDKASEGSGKKAGAKTDAGDV